MNKRLLANIAAFITVFLWASAFPLTKIIGNQLTANPLSLLRCLVMAVLILTIGLLAKGEKMHIRKPFAKKDLLLFFFSGATGMSLYFICFNMGLVTLTSAESSILSTLAPVFTPIFAVVVFKERIRTVGWACILAAFCGVAVMVLSDGVFSVKVGALWILGMSVLFGIYCILNRVLSEKGYHPMEIVAYSAIFACLMLMPFAAQTVAEIKAATTPAILSAIYLGVFPTGLSYILWAKAFELADKTSEVANYMFVTPLISTVLGFLMLREIPDAATFVGGAIIIGSLILFNRKGTPKIDK